VYVLEFAGSLLELPGNWYNCNSTAESLLPLLFLTNAHA
jgi:hypothetical protein